MSVWPLSGWRFAPTRAAPGHGQLHTVLKYQSFLRPAHLLSHVAQITLIHPDGRPGHVCTRFAGVSGSAGSHPRCRLDRRCPLAPDRFGERHPAPTLSRGGGCAPDARRHHPEPLAGSMHLSGGGAMQARGGVDAQSRLPGPTAGGRCPPAGRRCGSGQFVARRAQTSGRAAPARASPGRATALAPPAGTGGRTLVAGRARHRRFRAGPCSAEAGDGAQPRVARVPDSAPGQRWTLPQAAPVSGHLIPQGQRWLEQTQGGGAEILHPAKTWLPRPRYRIDRCRLGSLGSAGCLTPQQQGFLQLHGRHRLAAGRHCSTHGAGPCGRHGAAVLAGKWRCAGRGHCVGARAVVAVEMGDPARPHTRRGSVAA